MARKNLLDGLMGDAGKDAGKTPVKSDPPARVDPARPRYAKGAIGAVSQSIAALKSRAISEIDPELILAGGVQDRLDYSDAENAALMESLRTYGQQVPVLVRPHPEEEGKYQIVYGRRRVMAMRDLGMPIQALIRDLDDADLIMAQGQENTARKDLSFIEKANFARQMRDADYKQKAMADALHMDKTQVSRMLSVIDRLPVELIEGIGAAPSVGRDRWLAMAAGFEKSPMGAEEALAIITFSGAAESDQRFVALMDHFDRMDAPAEVVAPKKRIAKKQPARAQIKGAGGDVLGQVTRKNNQTVMVFAKSDVDGFDEWLISRMAEIHQDWKNSQGE